MHLSHYKVPFYTDAMHCWWVLQSRKGPNRGYNICEIGATDVAANIPKRVSQRLSVWITSWKLSIKLDLKWIISYCSFPGNQMTHFIHKAYKISRGRQLLSWATTNVPTTSSQAMAMERRKRRARTQSNARTAANLWPVRPSTSTGQVYTSIVRQTWKNCSGVLHLRRTFPTPVHSEAAIYNRHYFSYIKIGKDWHCYNDEKVSVPIVVNLNTKKRNLQACFFIRDHPFTVGDWGWTRRWSGWQPIDYAGFATRSSYSGRRAGWRGAFWSGLCYGRFW